MVRRTANMVSGLDGEEAPEHAEAAVEAVKPSLKGKGKSVDTAAEAAEAPEKKTRTRTKTGRKDARASIVKLHHSLMNSIGEQRRAASAIPSTDDPLAFDDQRLSIKAVGLPFLLRDQNPGLFFDRVIMLSRTRKAGSRVGRRINKAGADVLAILRPRATEDATAWLMASGISEMQKFLGDVQRHVRAAKRKNAGKMDIALAKEARTCRIINHAYPSNQ